MKKKGASKVAVRKQLNIVMIERVRKTRNELKRKYEPESGVIVEQMYEIATDWIACSYMKVEIHTGQCLVLELSRTPRSNGNVKVSSSSLASCVRACASFHAHMNALHL